MCQVGAVWAPWMGNNPMPAESLNLLEAAIFTQEPVVGSSNCLHEANYVGYKRVPFVADERANLSNIEFPPSEQDEEVIATHAAAIDGRGVIVGVLALKPPR